MRNIYTHKNKTHEHTKSEAVSKQKISTAKNTQTIQFETKIFKNTFEIFFFVTVICRWAWGLASMVCIPSETGVGEN